MLVKCGTVSDKLYVSYKHQELLPERDDLNDKFVDISFTLTIVVEYDATDNGSFGAILNVRYTTIEVDEVDCLDGVNQFFVHYTTFGIAYRVIVFLGSDNINVTGDVTADIVTKELEGASGTLDHLI